MSGGDGRQYQGRQEHGRFGSGTKPASPGEVRAHQHALALALHDILAQHPNPGSRLEPPTWKRDYSWKGNWVSSAVSTVSAASSTYQPGFPVPAPPGIGPSEAQTDAAWRAARSLVQRLLESFGVVHDEPPSQEIGDTPPTSPADILAPNGVPIGEKRKGTRDNIRTLPGGLPAAEEMFEKLTDGRGGHDVTPPNYGGKMVKLPDGSLIGLRPKSTSGGPAIDIFIPGLKSVEKLHF